MALTTTTDLPDLHGITKQNEELKYLFDFETHECDVIQRLSESYRVLKADGLI